MPRLSPDRQPRVRRSLRSALLAAAAVGALGTAGFLGAAPFATAQTQSRPVQPPAGPTVQGPAMDGPTAQGAPQGALTLEEPGARVPSFADVVERVKPAVVSVRVRIGAGDGDAPSGGMPGMPGIPGMPPGFDLPDDHPLQEFFRRFRGGEEGAEGGPRMPNPRRAAQGSGFFISEDGFVVTNNHVVSGAETVEILLDDGTTLEAEVVGTDEKTDLALLKVDHDEPFAYVEFAEQAPRVGDWVVAIGNPFGLGGTVTAGIVSARGRDIGAGPYDDFLQIDAPVNQGNSGGPAFDQTGQVIGVNTAISSPSGGNVGIAFAIPAETVQRIVAQLRETGSVERGYLGVQIQPVTEDIAAGSGLDEARGAIVARVEADTPAGQAGVETGDIVLELDGRPVEDARDLSRTVAFLEPGREITLTIWRDGARQEIRVAIGRMPSGDQQAATEGEPAEEETAEATGTAVETLGVTVGPAEGDAEGVAVVSVDPEGPAFEKGLAEGDVIAEIGGEAVAAPADVTRAIEAAEASGRGAVLLRVERDGNSRFVAFRLQG